MHKLHVDSRLVFVLSDEEAQNPPPQDLSEAEVLLVVIYGKSIITTRWDEDLIAPLGLEKEERLREESEDSGYHELTRALARGELTAEWLHKFNEVEALLLDEIRRNFRERSLETRALILALTACVRFCKLSSVT